jgi:flagellar hook assembly protein FlgD
MLIKYELPQSTFVQLRIFDLNGKEVMELLNKEERPGIHQVVWNGKDKKGDDVPSGVYLYQLRAAGSIVKTRKAIFIK